MEKLKNYTHWLNTLLLGVGAGMSLGVLWVVMTGDIQLVYIIGIVVVGLSALIGFSVNVAEHLQAKKSKGV